MEKLLMCRICLSNDIGLRSIVNTHLHEMYEFLTKMPFVTEDSTPILACGFCCAKLDNTYELRRRCLRSEKLFTQLLRSNAQGNLQTMPAMLLSVEDVLPMTSNAFDSDEVKQEAPEDARDDSSASSGAEDDTGTRSMIKTELDVDNVVPSLMGRRNGSIWNKKALNPFADFEEDPLRGDDNIQSSVSEDTISLAVVKEEQSDVTASVPEKPRLDAQKNREDKPPRNLKRSDQSKDKIEEPKSESKQAVEDKPVKKNKRVETCDKLDMKLHNSKQNNKTSDRNDVHKEISANNIRAHPSVNSNSSNELKQFVCDTCQKCFRYKTDFVRHIRIHTEKPYQCNICGKCFYQKANFDYHIRSHTGEKPYKCNECKKCFILKSSLNKHTRTHTGEKPYQCNVCKTFFNQKNNLNTHIRTHTGEKPYQCNVCKTFFNQKDQLNRHIRTHTGEKPYQCNECEKYFSRKDHLDIHTRTHTGKKPYQCNKCKKCFSHKNCLNNHFRTHTGEKPYQCNECKKYFSRKDHLDIHTRTHR